ncbi:MAG: F0F1 ATP synthase subunit gamma [Gammaproteobacteria bacterium]
MANAKEIRGKIGSIKKTQKITTAMQMIAASKMRKCQQRMQQSKPFAKRIHTVIQHLARSHSEYHHPYLLPRELKRVGFIVISSDRGLCGGFNVNLFKTAVKQMKQWHQQDTAIEVCVIGSKAEVFFKRQHAKVVAVTSHLGDNPTTKDVIGVVKVMLDKYDSGELDGLFIAHNTFISTMKQQPTIKQLLPLLPDPDEQFDYYWDYIYEPDAREILDKLLVDYIESQVYQGVIENIACEQAARMFAMQSASDNAGAIIDELQLAYNKARQAAITKELSEIVAGAAAV